MAESSQIMNGLQGLRVGFVTYWFNRGQATVSRWIRGAFQEAGIETEILIRPSIAPLEDGSRYSLEDVWYLERDEYELAPAFDSPDHYYADWANRKRLDVVFFFQNLQFKAVARLRKQGVRTIGTFMWEAFPKKMVKWTNRAFSTVYTLFHCQDFHFRNLGIDTFYVPWGCHPELFEFKKKIAKPKDEPVRFFFPAGYVTKRKNLALVLEAFRMVQDESCELVLKSNVGLGGEIGANLPDNVRVDAGQMTAREFCELYCSCDVAVMPSRWEGLGLGFFEAMALDIPVITTNYPPMSEYVVDKETGLLVETFAGEYLPSGIRSAECTPASLAKAVRTLCDRSVVERMSKNVAQFRENFRWERTAEKLLELVHRRIP